MDRKYDDIQKLYARYTREGRVDAIESFFDFTNITPHFTVEDIQQGMQTLFQHNNLGMAKRLRTLSNIPMTEATAQDLSDRALGYKPDWFQYIYDQHAIDVQELCARRILKHDFRAVGWLQEVADVEQVIERSYAILEPRAALSLYRETHIHPVQSKPVLEQRLGELATIDMDLVYKVHQEMGLTPEGDPQGWYRQHIREGMIDWAEQLMDMTGEEPQMPPGDVQKGHQELWEKGLYIHMHDLYTLTEQPALLPHDEVQERTLELVQKGWYDWAQALSTATETPLDIPQDVLKERHIAEIKEGQLESLQQLCEMTQVPMCDEAYEAFFRILEEQ